MNSNTNLTVDIQRPNIATVVYAVQGDSLSRTLTLTMIDGDKPWTPPADALAVVRYAKPDGTFGFYDTLENGAPAIIVAGSTATVTLAAQALTAPGSVAMQLDFYTAAAEKLSTFCWILKVDPAAVEDGKLESTTYISALTEAMAKAIELLPEIERAGEYAKSSGESAQNAADSEKAAGESADGAEKSASAAKDSETAADESAKASADSEKAAKKSADDAEKSASAAKDSETAADESAKAAGDRAQDAEAWAVGQRGGTDVPAGDPTYQNNAKYYAGQARSAAGGGVLSVNGEKPDEVGNVQLTAADIGAASVNSWTLSVPVTAWVSNSDASGEYKAEISAEGMAAETEIDIINFAGGDFAAAAQWDTYETGDGVITLFSAVQPAADFTLKLMEVKDNG